MSLLPVVWSLDFLFFFISFSCYYFFLIGPFNFSSLFCFDYFSWFFLLLTFYLNYLVFLSSSYLKLSDSDFSFFSFYNIILMFFLVLSFLVSNVFFFFFFFECCIIPIFLLILGWGFSMERLRAGLYLFFYTFCLSLPFLFNVFFLYYSFFVFGFLSMFLDYHVSVGFLSFFFIIMVFVVKLPCYFFHLWLPKAHVEAPLVGSMILAGILLKLGGYGIFRFCSIFSGFLFFLSFFLILGVLGGLLAGLYCFLQVDLKCMVAYMSVSHMGLLFGAFLTFKFFGFLGFLCMTVAHGLSSSGLFCLLGVVYDRYHTRSMIFLSGSMFNFGVISFWLFLILICNMSCPPTLNFFSEVFMSWGLFSYSLFMLIFFVFLMMVGCFASIHFFSILSHGLFNWFSFSSVLYVRESFLFFFHFYPLFAFFLFL